VHALLDAIRHWAAGVGGWGLFAIALLDSSFLSFPQVADALVLLQSARHPDLMAYYAGVTTLGSLVGCFLLYGAGRRGGEVFLRRRFKASHVDRALRLYQRFGILAVFVPALLPPPAPFKIFVLLSGAAGVSPLAFGVAVALGRGLRYFAQAWLAAAYGNRAADVFARHGSEVIGALAALTVCCVLVHLAWRRRGRVPADAPYTPGSDVVEATE
jgi:membrane protein YqaA with SNARE-associated domain